MGEVYRATDARLGRDVAIKVLPASVHVNLNRLRRFDQEARAAAALNCPNISRSTTSGHTTAHPFLQSPTSTFLPRLSQPRGVRTAAGAVSRRCITRVFTKLGQPQPLRPLPECRRNAAQHVAARVHPPAFHEGAGRFTSAERIEDRGSRSWAIQLGGLVQYRVSSPKWAQGIRVQSQIEQTGKGSVNG